MPESQVSVTTRQVNISGIFGESAWGVKDWPGECSSIIDTGFSGGGFRSYARLRKCLEYLGIFDHKEAISKTKGNLLRFAFRDRECRDSPMGEVIPIWAGLTSIPARVRLIRCKTELLQEWRSLRRWIWWLILGEINSMLGESNGKCRLSMRSIVAYFL